MKKFIGYLKDFHKSYFNIKLYVSVALFIAALIAFNYHFDFEDSHIDKYYGKGIRTLWYFLYNSLAYYGTLLIIWLHDKSNIKLSRTFWIKSLLGILILSTDRSVYPFVSKLVLSDVPRVTYRYFFKLLFNFYGVVTIVLVLFFVKLVFDRKNGEGLYGLKFAKVDFKAYFMMWLIMLPILYGATFLHGIIDYYPTYKRTGGALFANYYHIKEWVAVGVYEIVYLFDFLNTELFFRGFLVIGLSKLIGKNAVLPMAATYCMLHFGKPMGEAISSIFGGYILGIIALYSRNIWGGVFLHGGIALFMEIFAFWKQ